MLRIPELAMPRSRKVTTVCNGKHEVWTDYEEAKAYFLKMMMSTEGEERDRASAYTFSYFTDWTSAPTRTINQKRLCRNAEPFALPSGDRKYTLKPL